MLTKLQAAQISTEQGIETLIVNGKEAATFEKLKLNICRGTLFQSQASVSQKETRNERNA